MSDLPFAGQTIVITGAGTGIGRAAAVAFADQGAASVIATGRRADRLAETAAVHPAIVPVAADVTTADGAAAVVDAVATAGGTVDVIVHNAGIFRFTPTDAFDVAVAREVLETNLVAPMVLTSALLPALRSPGGSIVIVSSRAGHNPTPGGSAYGASKAAAHNLTLTWAAELAPRGIRVNAVAPGFVRTEAFAANGLPPEMVDLVFEQAVGDIPLGRVGEVDDVTPWITMLASPASSLVTGQVVTIDGGTDFLAAVPRKAA